MFGDDAANRSLRSDPTLGSGLCSPSTPVMFEVERSLLLNGANTSANDSDLGRRDPGYSSICLDQREVSANASGKGRESGKAYLALNEVFFDEITGSCEEIDIASVQAETDDGLFTCSRSIDPG